MNGVLLRIVLLIGVAGVSLVGCSKVHTEVRKIDGQKFLCTWRDPPIGPIRDLRCEPFPVSQP